MAYRGNSESADCTLKTAPDFKFCEDAAFWDIYDGRDNLRDSQQLSRRHVVVSCDPNRKAWNTVLGPLRNPDPHGALWLLEHHASTMSRTGELRVELKNYPPNYDFHPLGLAISPSYGNGTSNMFVVNHARTRTVIEQFTLSSAFPGVATHIRTLSSPYFVSPNSVALTSPDSFFVTNDHFMTRRLPFYLGEILPILETLLGLPFSWVSHISVDPDHTSPSPITEHEFSALFIPFANGISISPSGSQVAVASTSMSRVLIYSRDPASNALTHAHTVPVPFHPDNLEFDETGGVIVAGHPHFPSLLKVKADPTEVAVSPSWVVTITSTEVDTLFQSDGTGFSSSTTGLRDSTGALYVTGLYTDGILVCGVSLS
ncbi:hypothetical protein DFH07DRAFT_926855 [Mycena maculata]|uniref:Calcium-dependent phosphotriesterase n=1 Tax=Mycena maculata TaxID=230809 RepID=A0AAD7IDA4_9AGAR|nr:hypothetical protein DFH07DRAFT_926855 [Mycena maculata]